MNKVIVILMVLTMLSSNLFGQNGQSNCYYEEGWDAAKSDYHGREAITSFVGSTLLSFVGFGISYLVVTKKDIKVLNYYTSTFDEFHKDLFVKGYTKYVTQRRKKNVVYGGLVGTLASLPFWVWMEQGNMAPL